MANCRGLGLTLPHAMYRTSKSITMHIEFVVQSSDIFHPPSNFYTNKRQKLRLLILVPSFVAHIKRYQVVAVTMRHFFDLIAMGEKLGFVVGILTLSTCRLSSLPCQENMTWRWWEDVYMCTMIHF